jgi:heavy metal efflux system protein
MKRAVITSFLLCLVFKSFSQSLSMEDAVSIALKNNQSLLSASHKVESARYLKNASFDLPKTEVSMMFGQFNSYADNDNNFTIVQTIPFTIFGSQARVNAARFKLAQAERTVSENEIAFRVKQVYTDLQYHNARKSLLVSQDSIYSGFARAAELRHKAGESHLLEKVTAESQLSESRNALRSNALQVQRLQKELEVLMNLNTLPELSTEFQPYALTGIEDTALVNANPRLQYLKNQQQVAEHEHRLQRAKAAPDFHVGFFSQTLIGTINPENGQVASNNERFTGFQIGMAIPLFFNSYHARAKAALADFKAVESMVNYHQQISRQQLQQAYQQIEALQAQLRYYDESGLSNADLVLRQATISFRQGEIPYTEYLFGLRNASNMKDNYLKTVNDFNQAVIYLQYITAQK